VSAPTAQLCVLPREMRLQTERILFLTTLPKGCVSQATDVIILSQCLGLGGFELLEERFESLKRADLKAIEVERGSQPGHVEIEAGSEHAWTIVPTLLDFLAEAVADAGTATAAVHGALDPDELRVATVMGERIGLDVELLSPSGPGSVNFRGTAGPRSADGLDRIFRDALRTGVDVEPELWWRLYRLSNSALSPDSPVSRRHAGPLIVTDDGRIVGRIDNDDDTDFSFIRQAAAPAASTESAQ
jgi:hypothetical protein